MSEAQVEQERWRGAIDAKLDTIGRDTAENKITTQRLGDKFEELISELRKENQAAVKEVERKLEETVRGRVAPLEEWRSTMMGRLAVVMGVASLVSSGIVTFAVHYFVRTVAPQ